MRNPDTLTQMVVATYIQNLKQNGLVKEAARVATAYSNMTQTNHPKRVMGEPNPYSARR